MSAVASAPGALRLLVVSIAARLPLPMLTIGVLVHVQARTDSFAVAGLAGGALAVSQGVGGPLLGRFADRHGQSTVLLFSALACGGALAGLAVVPGGSGEAAFVSLAALAGLTTPPVAACMRALLPCMIDEPDALRRAYALDSAAVELTWVAGPPLVLGLGAITTTGVALMAAGGLLVVFTMLFAAAPASRQWRPEPGVARTRGGAVGSTQVRLLILTMLGAGLLFGATEVGATAAADHLGATAAAGPLLGLWGMGGFVGGVAITRSGGGSRTLVGVAQLLGALAAAHLILAVTVGSMIPLAAGLLLAGLLIAPTCASAYALVDQVAPDGTTTEAFAWMATAVASGTAGGAAAAGILADQVGAQATFLFGGAAAALTALAVAGFARRTIAPTVSAGLARP